jgi:hypothetical protein
MRPPVDTIGAPPFPRGLEWVNVAPLRLDQQRGRPVLVEFFDFCRVESLRTLPYVRAWHERYGEAGLRAISVHSPGYEPARDADAARAAVARLGIEHAVCLDHEFDVWGLYDNAGWPARYLFDGAGMLVHYHYGEGAYEETEDAVRELLGEAAAGVERVGLLRDDDDPDAPLVVPTPEQPGDYRGEYAAGGVWAVLSGAGTARAFGREVAVEHPGAYPLVEHAVHTRGAVELELGDGVACHAVCFTPGLAE